MSELYIKGSRRSTPTKKAGQWNFADDGGAIGAIDLGVFVPAFAIIQRFQVKTLIAPVGAGATIAFGRSGDSQALMVVTGIAAFVANQCMQGVDLAANPVLFSSTIGAAPQVRITIAGAPITAGRILFDIEYTEYDF